MGHRSVLAGAAAQPMDAAAAERVLTLAIQAALPLSVALRLPSGGWMLCRPSGVRWLNRWIEFRDGALRLRLDESRLARAWAVHTPDAGGLHSLLLCQDASGQAVASATCVASAGRAATCAWRRWLDTMARS